MSTNAAETRPGVFSVTIRMVLGLLFVASAVLKGLDFSAFAEQVSYYGIVREDMHLQVVAAATIAVEILLGGALLIGWHTRFMLAVSAVILVAFTGLIVYAWAFNDLKECGCFGSFLAMTPAMSVGKNVVLLLLLPFAWPRTGSATAASPIYQLSPATQPSRVKGFVVGCVLGVLLTLALEVMAFLAYGAFFHDRIIANLEKKMMTPSPPGTPMPWEWQVRDQAGKPVDIASFQGKPLFVTFFSPTCPKCEAQLPSLERFYAAIAGDNIGFVAIATRESERLETVLKRQGCTFPVYTFGEKKPALFENVQVPSGFLFSKDGLLLYEQFESARWDDPAFVAFVKGLAPPQTQAQP